MKIFLLLISLFIFSCDDDPASPTDCAGVSGGEAVIDECGVCDGGGSSCADDCGVPNGDNSTCNPLVRGYVYNGLTGQPVPNSYIFLGYENIPNNRPYTAFSFNIISESIVNLRIENKCNEIVVTLVDDVTFQPGNHSVVWDVTNSESLRVLDGVYFVYQSINDEINSFPITLQTNLENYYSDCTNENEELICESIATTNSEGYFEFSQECLSIGEEYEITNEWGLNLGEQILSRLKLYTDDGQNYGMTNYFEVDEYDGAEINIYISNK